MRGRRYSPHLSSWSSPNPPVGCEPRLMATGPCRQSRHGPVAIRRGSQPTGGLGLLQLLKCGEYRRPRITVGTKRDTDLELADHLSHVISHVLRDDDLDVVIDQEASDSGVVCSLRSLVVQVVPSHVELLPVEDLAVRRRGEGDLVSPAPTSTGKSIAGHGDAQNHEFSLHLALGHEDHLEYFVRDRPSLATCSDFQCWISSNLRGSLAQ